MTRLYRQYRQVNFIQQGRLSQVRGVEEVSINGQRQVLYFGDADWVKAQEDRLLDSERYAGKELFTDTLIADKLTDALFNWPFASNFLYPQSILGDRDNINAIPDNAVSAEMPMASAHPSLLKNVQQGLRRGVARIRRAARKVPLALQAAWQELSQ